MLIASCCAAVTLARPLIPNHKQGERAQENGAWILPPGFTYHLDVGLAKAMAELVGPGKSLLDVGSGKGHWSRFLRGFDIRGHAVDGARDIGNITGGFVEQRDLTHPFPSPCEQYDWVMSMEVAEHIPEWGEDRYLANLNCSIRAGLIFSWSRHGNKGTGHINAHTKPWVIQRMVGGFGLVHDAAASARLCQAAKTDYLREAMLVFRRPTAMEAPPPLPSSVPRSATKRLQDHFVLLQTEWAKLAARPLSWQTENPAKVRHTEDNIRAQLALTEGALQKIGPANTYDSVRLGFALLQTQLAELTTMPLSWRADNHAKLAFMGANIRAQLIYIEGALQKINLTPTAA